MELALDTSMAERRRAHLAVAVATQARCLQADVAATPPPRLLQSADVHRGRSVLCAAEPPVWHPFSSISFDGRRSNAIACPYILPGRHGLGSGLNRPEWASLLCSRDMIPRKFGTLMTRSVN